MLRRVAPLLAAAAASAWTNLGPCGANGRWGETVEEKIFFLKTIKTAGSTTRFIFLRFARGERMALLRSSNPGHILLDSTGRSQRWVDAKRFDAVGAARPRPAGASRYDVALDHATLDAQALATYLPGARWVTVSRDVPSRVVSAIAMFHGDMSPRDYFAGCAALDRGLCRGVAVKRPGLSENVHIWNSVAWQLGERAAAPPIDFARPYASVKRLERADASALVDLVEGNHSGAFALVMEAHGRRRVVVAAVGDTEADGAAPAHALRHVLGAVEPDDGARGGRRCEEERVRFHSDPALWAAHCARSAARSVQDQPWAIRKRSYRAMRAGKDADAAAGLEGDRAAAGLDAVAEFLRQNGHGDAAGPPREHGTKDATVRLSAVVSFLRNKGHGAAADFLATFPWCRLGAYAGDMMRRMPPDTLTFVASWATRSDLLALRAAFAAGRDAVRRAVTCHPTCHEIAFERRFVDMRAIEAVGRVLGPGCIRLSMMFIESPLASALLSFVTSTEQKLEEITLHHVPLSLEDLQKLCRACPRLERLDVRYTRSLLSGSSVVEIASSLRSLCPKLSHLDLPPGPRETARGAAELWAMHFPRLKTLGFGTGFIEHRPSRFDKIRESVEKCPLSTDIDLSGCLIEPPLVQVLVQSPLSARLTRLSLLESSIEHELILELARSFPLLRDLGLPDFCDGAIFTDLHRTRPELKRLDVGHEASIDDACVKFICTSFRLEFLRLPLAGRLTRAVIGSVLNSPSSEILDEIDFDYTCRGDLVGSDLLSLADGCPSLKKMTWEIADAEEYRAIQATDLRRLSDLLRSRGGQLVTDIPEEDWR